MFIGKAYYPLLLKWYLIGQSRRLTIALAALHVSQ